MLVIFLLHPNATSTLRLKEIWFLVNLIFFSLIKSNNCAPFQCLCQGVWKERATRENRSPSRATTVIINSFMFILVTPDTDAATSPRICREKQRAWAQALKFQGCNWPKVVVGFSQWLLWLWACRGVLHLCILSGLCAWAFVIHFSLFYFWYTLFSKWYILTIWLQFFFPTQFKFIKLGLHL